MKKTFIQTMIWMLVCSITLPAGVFAQGSNTAAPVFRQEELAQMLAPIALYPDPLLVQMMMAATYPLEVVEAARWTNANPNLKGDQLASALEQKGWDPSVKSLVNFPNALAMMDGNLEWTQKLGDAFLAQKDEVMDTIQYLRSRAQTQGNLRTTAEQVVTYNDQAIAIEPANPEVIYAPVYNPALVYGQWSYPDYPPYYYYPPGYVIGDVIGGIISFGVGLFLGAAWWGYAWGGFDWHNHHVYCNPHQNNYMHRQGYGHQSSPGAGGHSEWRHDPSHRRNVAYRGTNVSERYGQATRPMADGRKDFRGPMPDARTTGTRTGERSNMEQRRETPGRDRAALDRHMAAPTNNRAVTEQRMIPPVSGRTSTDKRQDNPVVVERLGTHQRRDAMRPATQPSRPTTASAYGGTMRRSYQASGTMAPSFRSSDTVNPSNRGAGMMNSMQRVETINPSNRRGGMTSPTRQVETMRPSSQGGGSYSGGERGGFSGRVGNFGGGSSGRAGGFGGRG